MHGGEHEKAMPHLFLAGACWCNRGMSEQTNERSAGCGARSWYYASDRLFRTDRMSTMSRQFLRVVFLIWLCWYLAGPLFETFDFWDTPQEEMGDIASSESGVLIWAAAGLCVAVFVFQQFCRCFGCSAVFRVNLLSLLSLKLPSYLTAAESIPALDTSPLRL